MTPLLIVKHVQFDGLTSRKLTDTRRFLVGRVSLNQSPAKRVYFTRETSLAYFARAGSVVYACAAPVGMRIPSAPI